MSCELCKRDSGESRLCNVCAEAVRRVIQISSEQNRLQVSVESSPVQGTAARAAN